MEKIVVIGAGIIGLSTAVEIQSRGRNVTLITDQISPNTTGDISAGLWTPYLLEDTPLNKIKDWSKATQNLLLSYWKNGMAAEIGLSLQTVVYLYSMKENPNWLDITFGYKFLTEKQIKKINEKYKENFIGGISYIAFTVEPSKFLPFLLQLFLKNGGVLIRRKVKNFKKLFTEGYDIVVNCSGISSNWLANDPLVKPIRGQITRVRAPWQYHVFFINENYIIPNSDCVILGGTRQEYDYDLKDRAEDTEFILNGCYKAVPSLKNAEILINQVGLRPGRNKVRIEIEKIVLNEQKKTIGWIVHNYGHGGSGITLSKGCAVEAADLVENIIKLKHGSKL